MDGLYRIRVPRVFLQGDRQTEQQMEGYLTSFVRAVCDISKEYLLLKVDCCFLKVLWGKVDSFLPTKYHCLNTISCKGLNNVQ